MNFNIFNVKETKVKDYSFLEKCVSITLFNSIELLTEFLNDIVTDIKYRNDIDVNNIMIDNIKDCIFGVCDKTVNMKKNYYYIAVLVDCNTILKNNSEVVKSGINMFSEYNYEIIFRKENLKSFFEKIKFFPNLLIENGFTNDKQVDFFRIIDFFNLNNFKVERLNLAILNFYNCSFGMGKYSKLKNEEQKYKRYEEGLEWLALIFNDNANKKLGINNLKYDFFLTPYLNWLISNNYNKTEVIIDFGVPNLYGSFIENMDYETLLTDDSVLEKLLYIKDFNDLTLKEQYFKNKEIYNINSLFKELFLEHKKISNKYSFSEIEKSLMRLYADYKMISNPFTYGNRIPQNIDIIKTFKTIKNRATEDKIIKMIETAMLLPKGFKENIYTEIDTDIGIIPLQCDDTSKDILDRNMSIIDKYIYDLICKRFLEVYLNIFDETYIYENTEYKKNISIYSKKKIKTNLNRKTFIFLPYKNKILTDLFLVFEIYGITNGIHIYNKVKDAYDKKYIILKNKRLKINEKINEDFNKCISETPDILLDLNFIGDCYFLLEKYKDNQIDFNKFQNFVYSKLKEKM